MVTTEQVEDWILEAAAFDKRQPMVRAPGYSKFWPTIFYEPIDWGFHATQLSLLGVAVAGSDVGKWVQSEHVSPRREIYDFVMLNLLGPACVLGIDGKRLVWLRLGRAHRYSWRKVAKEMHWSHEKCRQKYEKELEKLRKDCAKKIHLTDAGKPL